VDNYYEVLKVKKEATTDQIKRAYITLITKYHPDIYVGDKIFAQQITCSLTEAYSILKDEQKRRDYDLSHQVNTIETIYQEYYSVQSKSENESESENGKSFCGKNYDQKTSRKYFKNAKRKSHGRNFLKRLFTSKLFYCLLFVFAIEALIIYFFYVKML